MGIGVAVWGMKGRKMGRVKEFQPMTYMINPEAMKILEERWSDLSPKEGTEECVCSWCGKMIGRDERDPFWEDHIEYCGGCDVCDMPIRMWKTDLGKTLELRFHINCLVWIVEVRREAANG
jgi:hypothetical protein